MQVAEYDVRSDSYKPEDIYIFIESIQDKECHLTFQNEDSKTPSGLGTGSSQLFGVTVGVAEASICSVYKHVTRSELPWLDLEEVRGVKGLNDATMLLYNKETEKGLDTYERR